MPRKCDFLIERMHLIALISGHFEIFPGFGQTDAAANAMKEVKARSNLSLRKIALGSDLGGFRCFRVNDCNTSATQKCTTIRMMAVRIILISSLKCNVLKTLSYGHFGSCLHFNFGAVIYVSSRSQRHMKIHTPIHV
jgi:hypothetical protein